MNLFKNSLNNFDNFRLLFANIIKTNKVHLVSVWFNRFSHE